MRPSWRRPNPTVPMQFIKFNQVWNLLETSSGTAKSHDNDSNFNSAVSAVFSDRQQMSKHNFDPAALSHTTRTLRWSLLGSSPPRTRERRYHWSDAITTWNARTDGGRTDGRTADGRTADGRTDGRTDGQRTDERTDGRTHEQTDERTDGRRTDGRTEYFKIF